METSKVITELQRLRYAIAYTSQVSAGVSILVVLSLMSLIAVLGLFFFIALSAWNTRKVQNEYLFVRTHAAAYFLSLMVCWVIQCFGSILNIEWLRTKNIMLVDICVAQGILKHIADVGIAIWTFVIAAHTFACLFLQLNMSRYVMALILSFGWIFIALIVGSGPAFLDTKRRGSFYDVSGQWCWISPEYKLQRFTLGYLIMFLSAFLSAVLYILTFFRLRGNIMLDGWKLRFRRVGSDGTWTLTEKYFADNHTMLVAKQMLLYPITYAVLILPIAIIRFISWSGVPVGFEWVIFSASFYMLSGFVNVILFTTTRRILPLSSLRIGNWYLVPSSRDDDLEKGAITVDLSLEFAPPAHAKAVTFATEPTFIRSPNVTRNTRRPPEITIPGFRDSCSDIYTSREGVFIMPPALSSHWSPDTPPLKGRFSRAMENISEVAKKI